MEEPWRERKKRLTRERMVSSALHLFAQHGFDQVSLSAIAESAEVGERTLLRYFDDKEELIFGDDHEISQFLADEVASRLQVDEPAVAVRGAFLALAGRWEGQHEHGRRRQQIIEAAPSLRARERLKMREHEEAVCLALANRGVHRETARVLATASVATAHSAISGWLHHGDPQRPGLAAAITSAFGRLARTMQPLI